MHRAVLTLLVGLMLSLSGVASALTFGKDGKQNNQTIPDHQTPKELLAPVDAEKKINNSRAWSYGFECRLQSGMEPM